MIRATESQIEAARAYESLHVPALFRQWAPIVADAAGIERGDCVLDIACGTGILAREARRRVGDHGTVAGLDASPGMLAVAQELAPDVDWREGLADSLPFPAKSFDAVLSQFGLMFFPDRSAAIQEMLRVLRPGGRLAVAVWDSLDRSEAYPIEVALLEERAGREAAEALRAPFVLGDKSRLVELFEGAGATAVEVETHHGTACFPSIRAMVEADLRGWLPVMGIHLEEHVIADVLAAAESALAQYVTDDGSVQFDAPAHVVIGRRPTINSG